MSSRPIPSTLKTTKFGRSKLILLAITISSIVIFLLTVLYILYQLWDTLFHRSRTNPFDSSSSSTTLKLHKFTYKELKSATNGFNPDQSIGKGGSGTVFRGVLRDGKSVAIKRLDGGATSEQAEKEFQSEFTILGSVRSPHIVCLLGYCIEKNKRVLVYEYMPNRSLQDYLFSNTSTCNWEIRFQIVQDVARALEFLHNECDPPVVHGDIKPSNVLLDWDYRAKISDFGLSRVKVEDEFGVDMFSHEMGRSQDLWKSQDLTGFSNVETPPIAGTPVEGEASCGGGEVDFALALQASSSSKNGKVFHGLQNLNGCCSGNRVSPRGKEVVIEDGVVNNGLYENEPSSVEHSKELELNSSQLGNDWWWKQDDSGELCNKDYVTEWIGCQICPTRNPPEWETGNLVVDSSSNLQNSPQLDKLKEEKECPREDFRIDCPEGKGPELRMNKDKHTQKSKPRKMQDWWKEEELDEEKSKRGSRRKTLGRKIKRSIRVPHFDLGRRFYILKRGNNQEKQNNHNPSREFSFKKGRRSRSHSNLMGSEMSGDLFSRELSSTTSMRGTLCYVAPEYGGCGYLMEKGDIYSLGVLILVIVSGRRPLHVLNSPMKLEKANLISWCRHLAQSGNVLELVDERLKDAYNKEQAGLCIHLALACLQKMPELRPDIGDIVRILNGEMELPPLPLEFSPSPPSRLYSRSRRRQNSNAE